jgi:hypothetical protein
MFGNSLGSIVGVGRAGGDDEADGVGRGAADRPGSSSPGLRTKPRVATTINSVASAPTPTVVADRAIHSRYPDRSSTVGDM